MIKLRKDMGSVVENWRLISWSNGFYEVSDKGRVRSLDRTYIRSNGRPLKCRGSLVPIHIHDGYQRVRLNVPGYPKWYTIHKLVAEAFIGPRPLGKIVAHDDGDPTHNWVENLIYKTTAENQADRVRHGTSNIHIRLEGSFSENQIIAIRTARASGASLRVLAADYDVTISMISLICRGITYAHIGGPIVAAQEIQSHRKLTESQIKEIIRRRGDGELIVPLSKEFGVSYTYVSKLYREGATNEGS
jgi:hypothetical protein